MRGRGPQECLRGGSLIDGLERRARAHAETLFAPRAGAPPGGLPASGGELAELGALRQGARRQWSGSRRPRRRRQVLGRSGHAAQQTGSRQPLGAEARGEDHARNAGAARRLLAQPRGHPQGALLDAGAARRRYLGGHAGWWRRQPRFYTGPGFEEWCLVRARRGPPALARHSPPTRAPGDEGLGIGARADHARAVGRSGGSLRPEPRRRRNAHGGRGAEGMVACGCAHHGQGLPRCPGCQGQCASAPGRGCSKHEDGPGLDAGRS
mmetsp:Transcript_35610/g.90554  ORF Transcript_35610/g.90554 Transcript_35610/m.90554 type:complete len:266 (+) Transcript_35610:851-1648(+)